MTPTGELPGQRIAGWRDSTYKAALERSIQTASPHAGWLLASLRDSVSPQVGKLGCLCLERSPDMVRRPVSLREWKWSSEHAPSCFLLEGGLPSQNRPFPNLTHHVGRIRRPEVGAWAGCLWWTRHPCAQQLADGCKVHARSVPRVCQAQHRQQGDRSGTAYSSGLPGERVLSLLCPSWVVWPRDSAHPSLSFLSGKTRVVLRLQGDKPWNALSSVPGI